jgi:hypothetical protein
MVKAMSRQGLFWFLSAGAVTAVTAMYLDEISRSYRLFFYLDALGRSSCF